MNEKGRRGGGMMTERKRCEEKRSKDEVKRKVRGRKGSKMEGIMA